MLHCSGYKTVILLGSVDFRKHLVFCVDRLVSLCERPYAGLGSGGEAGVSRGHNAAEVGGHVLLVTNHHFVSAGNHPNHDVATEHLPILAQSFPGLKLGLKCSNW